MPNLENINRLIDSHRSNNKRIAKNTLFLYGRMLFTIIVSFYASRIIVNTLGKSDYGLYVLVGSIVTMFSFWAMSMQSATNRFLAYELGTNDERKLYSVFASAFVLHTVLAILLVLILEIVGLYSIKYVLKIESSRMFAANVVFHCSVFICCIKTLTVPFIAAITAYERMNTFAVISIIEILVKLFLVLYWTSMRNVDKLVIFALILLITSQVSSACYFIYCLKNIKQTRCFFKCDITICRNMLSFSGWNLLGAGAWVIRGQGINVIFNLMYPTTLGNILNGAYGIASHINSIVLQFVSNFRTAVNPQIVKNYAKNDKEYVFTLLFESTKYSYYLLLLLAFPVIIEADFLLKLWLVNVPEYAVIFCQLVLCNSLFQCIQSSLDLIFHASGKMKENQIASGLSFILIIPLSYFAIKAGAPPQSVIYMEILLTFIVAFVIKYQLLHTLFNIKLIEFWKFLVKPCFFVTVTAIIVPTLLRISLHGNRWLCFFAVEICACVSLLCSIFFIGLTCEVKKSLWKYLKVKLQKD